MTVLELVQKLRGRPADAKVRFQDKARDKLVKATGGKGFKHGTVVWTSDLAKGDVIER